MLQQHYNNPGQVKGRVTTSGMALRISETLRPFELGTMMIGDSQGASYFGCVTTGEGVTQHRFVCHQPNLVPDQVTAVAVQHHMHGHGIKSVSRQYDKNGKLKRKDVQEYYDYNYQQPVRSREAWTFERGDSFEFDCFYDSTDETMFGPGSNDEMCFMVLFFYPAMNESVCNAVSDTSQQLGDKHTTLHTYTRSHTRLHTTTSEHGLYRGVLRVQGSRRDRHRRAPSIEQAVWNRVQRRRAEG
jgi:hypothetical protein